MLKETPGVLPVPSSHSLVSGGGRNYFDQYLKSIPNNPAAVSTYEGNNQQPRSKYRANQGSYPNRSDTFAKEMCEAINNPRRLNGTPNPPFQNNRNLLNECLNLNKFKRHKWYLLYIYIYIGRNITSKYF